MIKMVRVDDRLIHGQVAVVWSKQLGIDRIVVANDSVAHNEVQIATLKMAAPSNIKCNIMTVDDACDVLSDPRAASMKILVITNNPADARKVCECAKGVELFDVGNYGLVVGTDGKRKIADTFYASDEDIANLKAIIDLGIPSIYQLVPTIPAKQLSELI